MSAAFNKLSAAQVERLALLAEECGEVIQAIGKVLRHGYESRHPDGGPTNREALAREIGDMHASAILMESRGDIRTTEVLDAFRRKQEGLHRWMHCQDASE